MPGPSKEVLRHLAPAELAAAIEEAQKADETRLVRRLCYIRNLYRGDTVTEAADRVGVSQPTGSRWVEAWNANGVAGLEPDFGGGRPPKLDADDRALFKEVLDEHHPLTTEQVRRLLAEGLDVTYSRRHIPRLLESLGLDDHVRRQGPSNRPATGGQRLEESFENALADLEAGLPDGGHGRRIPDD